MPDKKNVAWSITLAAVAAAIIVSTSARAEDAKPEAKADKAAYANQLDPNSQDVDAKVLDQASATSETNGQYKDKDGDPTFRVTGDGKSVDWYLYSGYRRYHSECHVCHGPDGMGSSYAPALKDSLKHLSYGDFMATVAGGKQEVNAAEQKVMPAFATNKNVMCYADDLYVYLRARAAGAWGRARPGAHEDKPDAVKKAETECLSN